MDMGLEKVKNYKLIFRGKNLKKWGKKYESVCDISGRKS